MKNSRSATLGSGLLDCMTWDRFRTSLLYIVPPEEFIVRVREKRQNFVKEGYADTRECQKRCRIFSCIRIFHTFDNVKIACMRKYSIYDNLMSSVIFCICDDFPKEFYA